MAKKKKGVKDKYYKLAKEQGYRARSSFKLIQLNRKYGFLEKATRFIDLCAAPGGWLQVAVKCMPKTPETQIIGVDLLPIKSIRGCVTFQEDITSEKCKKIIRNEMKGKKAEVVVCDGAPNVGADYSKDAFVQSELVVHALRFATEHLAKGGIFISKVFRSADYNSLMWTMQQFFRKVEATKPASSRNVSAEIFVVCQGYLAPQKIDPKLLDPKYVFAQVEADKDEGAQAVNDLFHKKNNQKKNRAGYDESMGQSLFVSTSVSNFVSSREPILLLAKSSAVKFERDCEIFKKHPATTSEIIDYLADLKVLGKSELRQLLRWRVEMLKHQREVEAQRLENAKKKQLQGDDSDDDGDSEDGSEEADSEDNDEEVEEESESEDEEMKAEMERLRAEEDRKKKREKKRKAREHAKLQVRKNLGMENQYALDVSELNGPFRLKHLGIKSMEDLQQISEVNLSKSDGTTVPLEDNVSDDCMVDGNVSADSDDERDYLSLLEDQMDEFYSQFKKTRAAHEPMNVQQRRQKIQAEKLAKRKKRTLETLHQQDIYDVMEKEEEEAVKSGAYLKLLAKGSKKDNDSDESSSESDDDDEALLRAVKPDTKKNPLLADFTKKKAKTDATSETQAKRWFSQGLFEGVEDEEDDEESEEEEEPLPFMPTPSQMTDKAKRHEKRLKLIARKEKKEKKAADRHARDAKLFDRDEIAASKFETVPKPKGASVDDDVATYREHEGKKIKEMDPKVKELIRQGMGKNQDADMDTDEVSARKGFEVVPKEADRNSSSEDESDAPLEYHSEDYDTDERATHLALGAMMVRKSRKRDMLNAAYNRYAFNDDALPAWFVDDENKHNRPQLPITKEMVETIKARYKDLAAKPTHKVAEVRARKKRKLMQKVESAKRKAAAIVDAPDLSARSKMKAIEKAYKGATIKRPSAVYVVAKKDGRTKKVGKHASGAKVKLVDKRLRADMRNEKQAAKRGKKGGKGKRKR